MVHTPYLQFEPTSSHVDRSQVDRTMRGQQPIVFVDGRAKGNPTLNEIVGELQRGDVAVRGRDARDPERRGRAGDRTA